MNFRHLASLAAVVASLAAPAIANAQTVPYARPVQPRMVYVPAQGPAPSWDHRGMDRRVEMQRQIEARRIEEARRVEEARRAMEMRRIDEARRAEELRRVEAQRHAHGHAVAFEGHRGFGRPFDGHR